MIKKYFTIWKILTFRAVQVVTISRFGAVVFVIAKFLRFFLFLLFLIVLESRTKGIGGYTLWEVLLFFLTFNLVDTLAQFFLRETYRFKSYVVTGNFDFILVKPFSPLFRCLFGGTDILDIPIIVLSLVFITFAMTQVNISVFGVLLYTILVINALIIATAFHILVLCVGIITTEVDNTIMLYRDISQMGRFPIDIYKEPVRGILTFIIPVAIMITFPVKGLLGFLSLDIVFLATVGGVVLLLVSLVCWRYAVRFYTSASS